MLIIGFEAHPIIETKGTLSSSCTTHIESGRPEVSDACPELYMDTQRAVSPQAVLFPFTGVVTGTGFI